MNDADNMNDTGQDHFLDRDLGLLEFNRRVLQQVLDDSTPLLERVFFLGILTSNLDEFFMKRVSRLCRRGRLLDADRLRQFRAIVIDLLEQQAACFENRIRPALAENGIRLLDWNELSTGERRKAAAYFRQNVYPALTPQAVDPSHPFPFISNLSDSLAITLRDPTDQRRWFARVKIPPQFPQWIELPSAGGSERRYAPLRGMIQQHLGELFSGMEIEQVLPLRVTRGAVVELEHSETGDLLEQVEGELRERRHQFAVRLEHPPAPDPWLLSTVVEEFGLSALQIYEMPGELDYTDLQDIAALPIADLHFPRWEPRLPVGLENPERGIFSAIRRGDILLHHPYDSFDASVARFIRAAVDDEDVLAIKMTLYRTSDDNPFVPWLIEAAESGKQVACLVELKARFDEHRNIRWANALRDAGVNVVHGVLGKKTHTKTALVVRRENERVRSYAHIGTGNYHPVTARLYTDLGLLTCRPELTAEVAQLFHYLTGRSRQLEFPRLLVAPMNMKQRFMELIEREAELMQAGRPAAITAKMNQLEDRDICRALYDASQAGVPVNLIVRGFCVLRPATARLSPTVRVISIIGRFLEHSRLYYFRNGQQDPVNGDFYLGSADWMQRNLEQRIEAVTPIAERPLRERLWALLQIMLQDRRLAWEMQPDGSYRQLQADSQAR
ncbi:MAG: polyphosphate kinase 1, partial [Xanthomonadales bacterium]|nr:polyphosphate kinase 1 [Xanthomonadales bacterium]